MDCAATLGDIQERQAKLTHKETEKRNMDNWRMAIIMGRFTLIKIVINTFKITDFVVKVTKSFNNQRAGTSRLGDI